MPFRYIIYTERFARYWDGVVGGIVFGSRGIIAGYCYAGVLLMDTEVSVDMLHLAQQCPYTLRN